MSWYNPRSWGGDIAKDVSEKIGKAFMDAATYAYDHPRETGTAVAAVLLSLAAYEAAKTGGRSLGAAGADEIIKLSKEEYEVD